MSGMGIYINIYSIWLLSFFECNHKCSSCFKCICFPLLFFIQLFQSILALIEEITNGEDTFKVFANFYHQNIFPVKDLVLYIALLYLMYE